MWAALLCIPFLKKSLTAEVSFVNVTNPENYVILFFHFVSVYLRHSEAEIKKNLSSIYDELISKKLGMLELPVVWELGLFPIWGLGKLNCCYWGINLQNAAIQNLTWDKFSTEGENTELKGKAGQRDSKVWKQKVGRICVSKGTTVFGLMLMHWGLSSANYIPFAKLRKKCTPDDEIKSPTKRYKKIVWGMAASLFSGGAALSCWSDILSLQLQTHFR